MNTCVILHKVLAIGPQGFRAFFKCLYIAPRYIALARACSILSHNNKIALANTTFFLYLDSSLDYTSRLATYFNLFNIVMLLFLAREALYLG